MMKARRTYKEDLKKAATAVKEKDMVQAFEKDMKQAQENKELENQLAEFKEFLSAAAAKPKPFGFLLDMYHRLVVTKNPLSENMQAAVHKCMDREKEWTQKKEDKKAGKLETITLKVKPFIMKDLGIDSRIITGVVKAESAKAWLIEGHADMLHSMSFCARCGKELTEPASQVTGFGPTCADKLGIPYDAENVKSASKKKRESIRKQYQKKLHNQTFERWIPKSQAEVFEG